MQTVTIKPRFSETDAMGHINNTAIAVWFEAARVEYLNELFGDVGQQSPSWVQASLQLDYLRECSFGSEASVEVSVTGVGNSSFSLSCRIYQSGELKVVGSCVLVNFDRFLRKSTPLTEDMKDRLQREVLSFQRLESAEAIA